MGDDAGIEAVRAVRREISRQFDNDPAKIIRYYMEMQIRFRGRLRSGPEEVTAADPVEGGQDRG